MESFHQSAYDKSYIRLSEIIMPFERNEPANQTDYACGNYTGRRRNSSENQSVRPGYHTGYYPAERTACKSRKHRPNVTDRNDGSTQFESRDVSVYSKQPSEDSEHNRIRPLLLRFHYL